MHPVEVCIEFPKKDIKWLEPLITDEAWVHMMAFSSYAFFDMLHGHSIRLSDQKTSLHFTRSLRLLRQRLTGDDQVFAITNTTVQIVMSLATLASMQGEFEEAKAHMMGLKRIVELRGGIERFRQWPKLMLGILR
jgi:hypothetical protein